MKKRCFLITMIILCINSCIIYATTESAETFDNSKGVSSQWGYNFVIKNDGTLWIYGEEEGNKRGYTALPTKKLTYL